MVFESVLVLFFYKWLTSFPSTIVKEIVFSPLCILASFVKDKVSICVWIYLRAFYFVYLVTFFKVFFFLFLFFLTLGEGGRQEGRLAYLVFAEWFSVGESFTM